MTNNFFGSKLNTVLLFILIVLMVVAIVLINRNRELYLHPLGQDNNGQVNSGNNGDNTPAPVVSGNKDDLVTFSVAPGAKVSGIVKATGTVKNNYFFEANIRVAVLDANKKLLRQGHGTATTDWMTTGPVSFETTIDFTGLAKGPAYIEIANDNPSGLPQNDKSIYIPVVIQ